MKKYISLIIGGISVIATVTVYLLALQNFFKYPMCWIALLFIVVSEIATSVLFHVCNGSPAKVACGIVALGQTVATIVLSLIFINILIFNYTTFIICYLMLFVIAAVICIILLNFDANRLQKNIEFKQAKNNIIQCRSIVNAMINSDASADWKKELEALDENLRFCDDSSFGSQDGFIYQNLQSLAANIKTEGFDVKGLVNYINDLIAQRNFEVKNSK